MQNWKKNLLMSDKNCRDIVWFEKDKKKFEKDKKKKTIKCNWTKNWRINLKIEDKSLKFK